VRPKTLRWITAAVATGSIVAAFANPASAEPTDKKLGAQVAQQVDSVAGTAGVVPVSQSDHDADSAAVVRTEGGTVDIPRDPAAAVTLTTNSGVRIGIGIPNADDSGSAQTSSSDTTVFVDRSSESATTVQPMQDGVRQLFTLINAKAPTSYVVPLLLPEGARLVGDNEGGYNMVQQGSRGDSITIAHVSAPWAKDARGRSLPTRYESTGQTITQHIDRRGAVFPVVADPKYTWGWVTGTIYFNKLETKRFAVGVGVAAFIATFAGPWAPLLRGIAAWISAVAGWAITSNRCVKVKSTLVVEQYDGGYCR